MAKWAWEYFQRAQNLLEEARNRRMELEQANDDLADANQQLTRLNLLAQGLRQEADDARTAKAQFVANVSHELRTPLNMITGFSEMILQSPETYGGSLSPALLADLSVIQRNAEHLGDLINDVLDLSQVDADQMALTKEYIDFTRGRGSGGHGSATALYLKGFISEGRYCRRNFLPFSATGHAFAK